jgi:hypothetical protein
MEKENIYNKVAKIIQKPYFKDLSEMGFHDKKSHDQILSIVFNKPVYITDNWNEVLDKKDNNPLYYETPDGYWELYRWDYGNLIEHEELDMGNLSIYRYDQNENQIYYENNGFWIVSEFNSNNELIYREKSDGDIYDIRSKKNITESVEDKNSYYKKIIPLLKKPYMVDFHNFNIPIEEWGDIFKMIYGWRSTIHMSQSFGFGGVSLPQYVQVMLEIPHTGKELLVYYEDEDGDWVEKEYDTKTGKLIGFEDGDGKSYVTESVDRKQKFYDYIVKTMLEDTEYEILDKNYGGTMSEKIASVKFPMYPWEEYTYKPWDVHRWKSGWMMGSMDIDYVVNNFGVDEELAEIIFKKYIKELSLEISEKMPF